MNSRRSLRQVLARQWIAFTLVLFAGFAAMALVLLYVLEDSFIDQRLRAVAAELQSGGSAAVLPERFVLHDGASAPEEVRARMQGLRPGAIREFRLRDGRYVHVLAARARDGAELMLLYDVSDQLRVNASLRQAWPWLLLVAAILVLCAYGLAAAFVSRVSRQAGALLAQAAGSPDPVRLRELADATPIHEFSELARLNAEAWEARLAALNAERETLAFLGHELRTPLQSARTSLALLQEDRDSAPAWARLQRAVDRLARASNGVLWLAADAVPAAEPCCAVGPLVEGIAAELAPMASARGQQVLVRVGSGAEWPLPAEVLETVLANLLLNAIQHGGAGRIEIDVRAEGLELSNPIADESSPGGFGIGMQVVQRLLGRFGWTARLMTSGAGVRVSVGPGAENLSPGSDGR